MQSRQSSIFVPLNNHLDYEIETTYPHSIRSRRTHKVVEPTINKDLCYMVTIDKHRYALHRLIAEQFVPNDNVELNTCVIHCNKIPYDNHISNIKWVSQADVKHEHMYVDPDDIPFDLYPVGFYTIKERSKGSVHQYNFRGYYYSLMKNAFYQSTGYKYRVLHFHQQGPRAFVYATDTLGRTEKIYFNDFRNQNGLNY